MRNKVVFFLVIISLQLQLFSQIPGYMGKRFTIGYSTSLCPNFISGTFERNSHLSFLTHSINVGYVTSTKREVCFSARYNTRKMIFSAYIPYEGYTAITEKISSMEYSLGLKKYTRLRLAPVGAYSKWEAIFIASRLNYSPYATENNGYVMGAPTIIYNAGGTIQLKSIGGAYTRGWQRIFADKIVVDYGAKGMGMLIIDNNGGKDSHTKAMIESIDSRLSLAPIFNVFVGIGFLAF